MIVYVGMSISILNRLFYSYWLQWLPITLPLTWILLAWHAGGWEESLKSEGSRELAMKRVTEICKLGHRKLQIPK
jgi:hypothetical protein